MPGSRCRCGPPRMVSVRYLVLLALREIGIEINDVDMVEDDRRYR